MIYRGPQLEDLPAINALMLRSKAHWGYDAKFMAACEDELTISGTDLKLSPVLVCYDGDVPVGVAKLLYQDGKCYLHHLFVDPGAMGQGIGRALMDWARRKAISAGFRTIEIEADPFAAPFYEHLGAVRIGKVASQSIPGRDLPLHQLKL